ncbi:MAG TPA: hypothetical protein VHE53_01645 [Patescibacteria group bacterium]|nr:hypothetical protein [Patescibacteria group bacterium]
MGKVKVRVLGDEQQEQEQIEEQKKKAEAKAQAKKAKVSGVNLGGGERINSVGVSEADIEAQLSSTPEEKVEEVKTEAKKEKKAKKKEARVRSKRHTANTSNVADKTTYPVAKGVEMLRKFKKSNFDETVELHINTKEKGVSGQVVLPHGTGKKLRIVVADDAIIAEIEKGKIDFDVLVATPDMMPKLARVAKVLGPRGLMPNPKAGTITTDPKAIIEKLSAGQITYKTEAQAPIIHVSVGKLSFEDKQIEENVKTLLGSIGANKINNVTLKSTMSPAISIQA